MLLKIVTDEELLTSQIVKIIFLVVLTASFIYNLFKMFRSESKKRLAINSSILLLLSLALMLVYKEYRIEEVMLNHPKFTSGITKGYCNAFARGEGIEFEYEVYGVKYCTCNTYHPVSKDMIIVPGGKYFVRYSEKYPENGRMNFSRPVP